MFFFSVFLLSNCLGLISFLPNPIGKLGKLLRRGKLGQPGGYLMSASLLVMFMPILDSADDVTWPA